MAQRKPASAVLRDMIISNSPHPIDERPRSPALAKPVDDLRVALYHADTFQLMMLADALKEQLGRAGYTLQITRKDDSSEARDD